MKKTKSIKIMFLTAILVLGLAVPAFADMTPIDLTLYKNDSYPDNPVVSHAQDSVDSAYLNVKDDGSKELIVITKWFTRYFIDGIMTQIKYYPEEGVMESNLDIPSKYNNGQLNLPLAPSTISILDEMGTVELPGSEVRNNVDFGIHFNNYTAVDAVISNK